MFKFNHGEKNIGKSFGIGSDDIKEIIDDFTEGVVFEGSISRSVEKILVKLNNLEGEKRNRYWGTILFLFYTGTETVAKNIAKELIKKLGKV